MGRNENFKNNGKTANRMRGARANHNIELRKNKRADQLMKRRNLTAANADAAPSPLGDSQVGNRQSGGGPAGPSEEIISLAHLPEICAGIFSGVPETQLKATERCRRLLSKAKDPPIDEVIEAGLVPALIQELQYEAMPKLQFEAAWALTNIASGSAEQTQCVVDAGALPVMTHILSSPEEEVREQALWAIGNIAGDGPVYRDMVLDTGILPPLLDLLQTGNCKLSMMRNATWVLSNLIRGKNPQPNFEVVRHAIPTLGALISSQDEETVIDATWAVSYLSDGENHKIQAIVDGGLTRRLVELLYNTNIQVKTPALRAIGNIVTGTDEQTQNVLDCSGLPAFASLLGTRNQTLLKETCWTISNITAGSPSQIQAVIDSNIIPPLIEALKNGEFRVKKEAAWALSNLSMGSTQEQLRYCIEQGCIPPLCNMLSVKDARIVGVVLDALTNILKAGAMPDGSNPCVEWIDEAGGVDQIEALQSHENDDIYKKSLEIIESYFQEEEEEDHSLAPETAGSNFAFGHNSATAMVPVGGFAF